MVVMTCPDSCPDESYCRCPMAADATAMVFDDVDRLYLAGPMTGYPEFNYPEFHRAARALRAAGYVVVNPAERNNDGVPPPDGTERPWTYYVRLSLSALLTCNRVALLGGWHESRGALLEVSTADALGMRVMVVDAWLREAGA